MKKHLKNFFIPHAENGYHPHLLHTKRAVFYSIFFLLVKLMAVGVVLLIPTAVFVSPDVLQQEEQALIRLTNDLRATYGVEPLNEDARLFQSATLKTEDMAAHQYFGHVGPDGRNLQSFLSATGYDYRVAGENLAIGFDSAEKILNAWIASPAHLENLIDPEYQDMGIHLASGMYGGYDTVFVAEHFGLSAALGPGPQEQDSRAHIASANDVLLGQIYELNAEQRAKPVFHPTESFLSWKEVAGETQVTVRAVIDGDIASAAVVIGGEAIDLSETADSGVYGGVQRIALSPEALFRVAVPPTIRIIGNDGTRVDTEIMWQYPLVERPSILTKYERAKTFLFVAPFFSAVNMFFFGAMIFFLVVLLLNIAINIRRQHPHIIVQTMGVVLLLMALMLV